MWRFPVITWSLSEGGPQPWQILFNPDELLIRIVRIREQRPGQDLTDEPAARGTHSPIHVIHC